MKAVIAAAQTGGHINPGLAIANKIKKEESVPIKMISESGSSFFILFAIANPGLICPPVPAAAIITLNVFSLFYIFFELLEIFNKIPTQDNKIITELPP